LTASLQAPAELTASLDLAERRSVAAVSERSQQVTLRGNAAENDVVSCLLVVRMPVR
jgi:hypothetical protein